MDQQNIVFLIVAIILVGGVCAFIYANKKTKFYWRFIQNRKWKELEPHINKIYSLHRNAVECEGKPVSWVDRNITKKTKKEFYERKDKVKEYVDFCKKRNLKLPDNFPDFMLVMHETEIALNNPKDALLQKLQRTTEYYDKVYERVNEAGESLLNTRENSVEIIERVEALVNSIAKHPKEFDTTFEEILVDKESFKSALEFGNEQKKNLQKTAAGIGVGVSAGTAVASMAPTAAMWVATTFGTASTGTAISALGGAAATNAALAWLGGGALATGGGGIAAGQALLALAGPIGWGIAGASVAASVFFMLKKKMKIEENKRDEIARLKKCAESLKEVRIQIVSLEKQTKELSDALNKLIRHNSKLEGKEYTSFSDEQKKSLGAMVNSTKALSALISKTIV